MRRGRTHIAAPSVAWSHATLGLTTPVCSQFGRMLRIRDYASPAGLLSPFFSSFRLEGPSSCLRRSRQRRYADFGQLMMLERLGFEKWPGLPPVTCETLHTWSSRLSCTPSMRVLFRAFLNPSPLQGSPPLCILAHLIAVMACCAVVGGSS